MVLNPKVRLPDVWIDRCWQHARQMAEDYARGFCERSRSVTVFGADKDEKLLAESKMAECAFAIFTGTDPEQLHWNSYPDGGHDLFWNGKLWDVKTTRLSSEYLIWPIGKNHIFESKKFDAIVLVKHSVPDFLIYGWVSKADFAARKHVAEEGHKLFPGTWYVHQSDIEHFWERAA